MGSARMVQQESENNGCGAHGAALNGYGIEVDNGAVGDGNSAGLSCEGFRTYKRRRHNRMSRSETKLHKDGEVAVDSLSGFLDKTTEDPISRLDNTSCEKVNCPRTDTHALMNGSDDCPLDLRRRIVLEQISQSSCQREGGLYDCIQDALMFHPERGYRTATMVDLQRSDHACDYNINCLSQPGWMANGKHNAFEGNTGVMSNGSLSESSRTNADLCQRAFFDIVVSEKFSQLRSLFLESFPGVKADSFLDLGLVNSRMKEGAYDKSPKLFHADMQQLWTKVEKVGGEMVALAKSLSDKSRTCYFEQVGGLVHSTSEGGNDKFLNSERADCQYFCTCRCCGEKADGRDCLVCDSCEEMYHVSCVALAVESPSKNWYCAKCTANGTESPHDNCVVCEKLNASRYSNNGVGAAGLTNGLTFSELEENSNGSSEDGLQQLGGKGIHRCKLCQAEVENGDNFMMCGHRFCPHKYYHLRCLTLKQLTVCGPCWYCPSCLCRACLTDRDDDKIVLCDGCDHAYHIDCMQPPRSSIPRGEWFCGKCDRDIRKIRKAKKVYANNPKTRGEIGRAVENLENAQRENEELIDKSGGGVDMLLTAAKTLKFEEKLAAIEMKS